MRRSLLLGFAVLATALVISRVMFPVEVAKSAPDAPLSVFGTVPTDATAGQGGFIMKVYGNGFPADVFPSPPVYVVWNGVPIPAIMKSSTELHVEISREALAARGTATVGVLLQGPGGPAVTMPNPFHIWRSSSDINCDGQATAEDGLLILRAVAENASLTSQCDADANNDGVVDVNDALWVRSEVAGLLAAPLKSTKQ